MRHYELIKKWRLDEFEHRKTKTLIGIYVSRDGEFYAKVPEQDAGELVVAKTKLELVGLLKDVCDRSLGLEWKKVIAVTMEAPMTDEHRTRRHSSWGGGQWNPEDPKSAGHNITLSFIRYEVSERPDGKRCERDWDDGKNTEKRTPDVRTFERLPGEHEELPYSDELWAALSDFRMRLVELSHQIRTLISREDAVPRMIAASRQKLLTADVEVRRPRTAGLEYG